jgi:hypothetical protein
VDVGRAGEEGEHHPGEVEGVVACEQDVGAEMELGSQQGSSSRRTLYPVNDVSVSSCNWWMSKSTDRGTYSCS